jgi:hypothetical protein
MVERLIHRSRELQLQPRGRFASVYRMGVIRQSQVGAELLVMLSKGVSLTIIG